MRFFAVLGVCGLISSALLAPGGAFAQTGVSQAFEVPTSEVASKLLQPVGQIPAVDLSKNGIDGAPVAAPVRTPVNAAVAPKCKDGVQVPSATAVKGRSAITQYCASHGGVFGSVATTR
jgi:hypothetical protein